MTGRAAPLLRTPPARPAATGAPCGGCPAVDALREQLAELRSGQQYLTGLLEGHLRTQPTRRWSRSMPAPPKSDPPRPGELDVRHGSTRVRGAAWGLAVVALIAGGCGTVAYVGKAYLLSPRVQTVGGR